MTYFKWAEYRATKAGVKIHTKFNLGKGIPETIVFTNAKIHDSEIINELAIEDNCIYIFDRAYLDYEKFDCYFENKKFFITRLKKNSQINEVLGNHFISIEEKLLDENIEIIYDKVAYLGNEYQYLTKYPYRIVKIMDDQNNEITFVTNLSNLSTEEVAWLYKKRWEIELFFKWIKQNLKIKKFIGYSPNAVMLQIISAIISFVILRLIQNENSAYGLITIQHKIKLSIANKINAKEFSWANFLVS